MKSNRLLFEVLLGASALALTFNAHAKAPADQVAKLGKELTPVGSEMDACQAAGKAVG
jgi:hypothetical protein